MTIAWATIDAAFTLAVQQTSGLTDVTWRWEPASMRQPTSILLDRSPLSVIGHDGRERKRIPIAEPAPGAHPDRIAVRQHGQRSFDLQVRCTSDIGSPRDGVSLDSSDVLAQVVGRIQDRAVLGPLRAAGVALSRISPIQRQELEVDGREARVSVLVITWLCADVDERQDTQSIEHVEATVTVTGPDGSAVTRGVSTP